MSIYLVHQSTNYPGLLKLAWDRIEEFCQKYESESDPKILHEELARNYFSDHPNMLVFLGFDGDEVIGHSVATMENYFGSLYINFQQYWKNPGVKIPDEWKLLVFSELKKWGDKFGTDVVRTWARNEEVANIFEKYGFERDEKVIMNASLADVAHRLAELPKPEEKEE